MNSTPAAMSATSAAYTRSDYGDLESAVCDLASMAALTANFFEGCHAEDKGGYRTIVLCEAEYEQLAFAIYNVCARSTALKSQYYGAVRGKAVQE